MVSAGRRKLQVRDILYNFNIMTQNPKTSQRDIPHKVNCMAQNIHSVTRDSIETFLKTGLFFSICRDVTGPSVKFTPVMVMI